MHIWRLQLGLDYTVRELDVFPFTAGSHLSRIIAHHSHWRMVSIDPVCKSWSTITIRLLIVIRPEIYLIATADFITTWAIAASRQRQTHYEPHTSPRRMIFFRQSLLFREWMMPFVNLDRRTAAGPIHAITICAKVSSTETPFEAHFETSTRKTTKANRCRIRYNFFSLLILLCIWWNGIRFTIFVSFILFCSHIYCIRATKRTN